MPLGHSSDAAPVAFVGVFAAEDELSGEQTPMGFQDTPGQWYAARAPKRGASGEGEATLRDSQATQQQSPETTAMAPVFVCAAGSLGGDSVGFSALPGVAPHLLREDEEVDEDETQIVMSLSQDPSVRASGRKIEEQQFEAPPAATRAEAVHSASDDDGADSDMSDDMLAHDGPVDHFSALAATFQRQDPGMDEQSRKKAPVPVYRPRTQARHTPTMSVDDDDDGGSSSSSTGAETEVEGLEPTPAIRKKIKAIGGAVYEDDIEKATHVVAPKNQLKRTVKLLCGISRCEHILDEKWLEDSARAGAPLSEQDYCLLDTKAQEKWHFDLHKTMYEFTPAQRRQLFVGHTVFITNHKSVLPPVKDLVKIVECAGGRVEVKGSAGPSDVVITSEAALGVASVHKSLANANPQRIYSSELILSSILQQHIDFDKNHLEMTAPGTASSQKRSRK